MVAKGFLSEGMLTKVLSESLGIPMIDLANISISKDALKSVTVTVCEENDLIPISLKFENKRKQLTVAMSDPLNVNAIEEIEFTAGARVIPMLAQYSSISQAVGRYYRGHQVQISPLRFDTDDEGTKNMTVVRGGGEENIVDLDEPDDVVLIELEDEISDSSASAELAAAQRLGRAGSPLSQVDIERIDALERKFWALMRSLARKG